MSRKYGISIGNQSLGQHSVLDVECNSFFMQALSLKICVKKSPLIKDRLFIIIIIYKHIFHLYFFIKESVKDKDM